VKCSFDERGCAAGSGEGVSVPAVGKIPVELRSDRDGRGVHRSMSSAGIDRVWATS